MGGGGGGSGPPHWPTPLLDRCMVLYYQLTRSNSHACTTLGITLYSNVKNFNWKSVYTFTLSHTSIILIVYDNCQLVWSSQCSYIYIHIFPPDKISVHCWQLSWLSTGENTFAIHNHFTLSQDILDSHFA